MDPRNQKGSLKRSRKGKDSSKGSESHKFFLSNPPKSVREVLPTVNDLVNKKLKWDEQEGK